MDATLVLPAEAAWSHFDQALATRVFELTVHGIDLALAIGVDMKLSSAAASVVAAIFDERLDGDRPPDLADHPQECSPRPALPPARKPGITSI